jgi:hypothetical protein
MLGDHKDTITDMSNRRRQLPGRVQGGDDASFSINPTGTGVSMNWKTITLMIGGVVAVTTWCLGVTNTASKHTETLAYHSEALKKLEATTGQLNDKLDAVLWKSGINPHTVIKDAAANAPAEGR